MDVALGAAVRIRRRTIGISQEALAEQCGVSFQQIQKYENGANRISFSRLVQIARALKCRVVDLMDVLDGPDREITGDLDLLPACARPARSSCWRPMSRCRRRPAPRWSACCAPSPRRPTRPPRAAQVA